MTDLAAPEPSERKVMHWLLGTNQHPFVAFETPKPIEHCPTCGQVIRDD